MQHAAEPPLSTAHHSPVTVERIAFAAGRDTCGRGGSDARSRRRLAGILAEEAAPRRGVGDETVGTAGEDERETAGARI
jgi:hypothetical protein